MVKTRAMKNKGGCLVGAKGRKPKGGCKTGRKAAGKDSLKPATRAKKPAAKKLKFTVAQRMGVDKTKEERRKANAARYRQDRGKK
tara:strand:+ start:1288 stop:1542 length:255 start_codon:yes stop_codon:yes gene_type:complete